MGDAGPKLAIVGGVLLTISGIIGFALLFSPTLIIRNVFTLACGLLGVVFGKKAKESDSSGYIVLIVGLVATIGLFIPIGSIYIGYGYSVPISLTYTFIYIDPILILIGGILCIV